MNSWKRYVFAAIAVLGAILSAATLASATPSIYNVNRIIGAGSVTGFIETDGLSGVLTAADFVDWNLVLFDGTSTFDLMGPLSGNNSAVFVQGADTEAFSTYLLFNFSGIDNGVFLFQQGLFSDNHYYCDSSQPVPCFPGETVVPISVTVGYQNNPDLRGVVVIANETGTVPEPETFVLALTGLGLVFRSRRLRWFFIDGRTS
jgi:hypothetical protein